MREGAPVSACRAAPRGARPAGRLVMQAPRAPRAAAPRPNRYLLHRVILLISLLGPAVLCQQTSPAGVTTTAAATTTTTSGTATTVPAATTAATEPTMPDAPRPAANSSADSELILSPDEFVDSREVPLILVDGMANEDPPTTTAKPSPSSTPDSSQPDSAPRDTGAPATSGASSTTETSANGEPEDEDAPEDEPEEATGAAARAPAVAPFEPPQNISQYMDYIEKLFHDLRHQITHLFEPHLPQLIRTSQMVELTSSCSYDMLRMALALRQFEPWALRMIDSSGKVPEGIFEGSFTALGSYDECLATVFQSASSQSSSTMSEPAGGEPLPAEHAQPASSVRQVAGPTQGKYCLVTVSPFMPPKPPADKVDRLFQEEANRRNYTRDDQFSRLSPMFYYMKFRIGVCIPSTCDQSDMDSISSALSSSLRLNITIPDCRVRQPNQQLTSQQLVGGLAFALVALLVVLATLVDCFRLKWKQLEHQDMEFIQGASKDDRARCQRLLLDAGCLGGASEKQVALEARHDSIKIRIGSPHDAGDDTGPEAAPKSAKCASVESSCECAGGLDGECADAKSCLPRRLSKHWTWMSFSVITNFRLYFQARQTTGGPQGRRSADREPRSTLIACLDGIRVLSLCWVIVANSYLTLDPRATKRLTKTREAPRDFLFQLVVQASLAIETFFFLSGLLMSVSFLKRLRPTEDRRAEEEADRADSKQPKEKSARAYWLEWVQFYVHRYVRMTPPTMLVIAFSMYAYHYGDGPLWFEATQKVHQSCAQNWWRHLLHVANFIDTRQMCFIHYWYIAADMQLFLFAPIIMFLLFKSSKLGYCLVAAVAGLSIWSVFYTTYTRSLPPTLLFYSTDPESRREFGNTIMTKPLTHALPYIVGMLVGWWCFAPTGSANSSAGKQSTASSSRGKSADSKAANNYSLCRASGLSPMVANGKTLNALCEARINTYPDEPVKPGGSSLDSSGIFSATGILGSLAVGVALVELFLPYKWNNSHLPGRFLAATYASLFRLGWSLVLAYVVVSCRHRPGAACGRPAASHDSPSDRDTTRCEAYRTAGHSVLSGDAVCRLPASEPSASDTSTRRQYCYCGSGGNYLNRLLSLSFFSHLSKLSFVAYLIHLPLMSVFIGQTRGLFAFSHTLVIHFAISYLVISFALSFLLVHFIEFPFITFERLLFERLLRREAADGPESPPAQQHPAPNAIQTLGPHQLFYDAPRPRRSHSTSPQRFQAEEPASPSSHLHRTATGTSNQDHQITTERL